MSIPVLTLALAEHIMQFDEVDDSLPVMCHLPIEAIGAGRHVFQGAWQRFRKVPGGCLDHH